MYIFLIWKYSIFIKINLKRPKEKKLTEDDMIIFNY